MALRDCKCSHLAFLIFSLPLLSFGKQSFQRVLLRHISISCCIVESALIVQNTNGWLLYHPMVCNYRLIFTTLPDLSLTIQPQTSVHGLEKMRNLGNGICNANSFPPSLDMKAYWLGSIMSLSVSLHCEL